MATISGTPISGKLGRVTVDGVNLTASEWDGTVTTTEIDTYNFESGGYHEFVTGRVTFEGRVKAYWNGAANPHSNPPNIRAGQTVALGEFIDYTNANRKFNSATFTLLSVKVTNQADGKVEYEFSGKGNGTFTYPDATSAV